MKLVVGLGNFEARYNGTYHNMGFDFIDSYCEENDIALCKKGCNAVYGEKTINGEKVFFAKPTTFMNSSGDCVLAFMSKFKLAQTDILVVVDDIDLPLGAHRFREKGSAGTHNGLRDIVSKVGDNFKRIRIGIGNDKRLPLIDYVLSRVDATSREKIDQAINNAKSILLEKLFKCNK